MQNYGVLSIETHLFFARIMKEHALFLKAGFPCKDDTWVHKAEWYRVQFENLLWDVVRIADGRVNSCVLESEELVTEFTLSAEKRTEQLSGISIDRKLTEMEKRLQAGCRMEMSGEILRQIRKINERAIWLLDGFIDYKGCILCEVKNGALFNANYPLLIEHIQREAKCYRATLEEIMRSRQGCGKGFMGTEDFWNRIMMEHALFIRGLLDPCEEQLIDTANTFAEDYCGLLKNTGARDCRAAAELARKSLEETLKYREFKKAGVKGILDCRIASIILPLLADHVLREANHYIRILEAIV